jgi:Uma2 family endonuclease
VSTATLVSVEEYLATSYRPDCDYVDGVVPERNVGMKDHSRLLGEALWWFHQRQRALGMQAFGSVRIQASPTRFRIPDVAVMLPEPDEQIFTTPPYICIEVLSPDDTLKQMQDRFDDYLAMGVPNIWVLDPASHRAWRIVREGHMEVLDGMLRTHDLKVSVPLADLFSPSEE